MHFISRSQPHLPPLHPVPYSHIFLHISPSPSQQRRSPPPILPTGTNLALEPSSATEARQTHLGEGHPKTGNRMRDNLYSNW